MNSYYVKQLQEKNNILHEMNLVLKQIMNLIQERRYSEAREKRNYYRNHLEPLIYEIQSFQDSASEAQNNFNKNRPFRAM